jgi:hypothetical protein
VGPVGPALIVQSVDVAPALSTQGETAPMKFSFGSAGWLTPFDWMMCAPPPPAPPVQRSVPVESRAQ